MPGIGRGAQGGAVEGQRGGGGGVYELEVVKVNFGMGEGGTRANDNLERR